MRLFGAFGFAILSLAGVCAAQAQDRCTAYANEMVGIDQRARQMKCPAWKGHSDWNGHFRWCVENPAKVKEALSNWNARLDGCATSWGGQGGGRQPPPKPRAGNDSSRVPICSSYARGTVKWRTLAVERGCDVARLPAATHFVSSEREQFDACMGTSDAEFRNRSPQALGFKAFIEKQCTAQHRRPFRL